MTFPTRVQFTTSSMASLTATANTYSFSSCTAGNLIVICLAGDKNTGTLSVTDNIGTNGGANPWTVETSITGASVCLYIAWKKAVGGETTVTATTSNASTTGNSGYGEEMADDGAGAWMVVAKATPAYNDTARTSATSGTTDTADHDGRALAVGVIDSVSSLSGGNTSPTFTNFTKISDAPATVLSSGGGHAGCYVGALNLAAAATTSTTFATNGGSDQLTVAIAAFGRVESSTVEKTGSDSGTGSESGGVNATTTRSIETATGSDTGTASATVTSGDSATGSEAGKIAIPGGDSATGSETGYVSEGKIGGDSGTGSEGGGVSGTVSSGDTATGSESGSTAATLTPPSDTATGSEGGHIAIPGSDAATGVDAHLPPTYVTVTSGDSATGTEGGHVETLYGDLIVNLYGIDPDTGLLVPLPDYISVRFSRLRNDRGAITVDYPAEGENFDLLRTTVADNRDLEFELWTNGTPVGAMRGYLQEAAGDDVAEGAVWSFAGSFLEMRMDEVVVYPQDRGPLITDPDTGELVYTNPRRELIVNADNPGELVTLIVNQAKDRGALTDLIVDFTTTLDSAGQPWAGLLTAKYSPGITYSQILDNMVNLHLIEWAIVWNGTTKVLKVWNAEGRGADLTLGPRPVTLRRARNLLDAPRKWSVREAGTTMLAAGQEGIYDDWSDATALARRGRRIEKFATLGNASDDEAVLAFAQAELATNAPGLLTVDHGIGMLPGEPRPIIAFDIGDWVYSQVGTETERLRVVQWEVAIDANRQLTGKVALNDTVRDQVERLRERLNAIQSGEAVIGTSDPGPQVEDRTPPAAPEGVVASSIAYQDPDHGPGQTLAMVTVGWLPVTTNADGADSPLVQAAVFILDKMEAGPPPDPEDAIQPDWTWKECPQIVRDFAAPLQELWILDGSPDAETWLAEYIAEMSQVPTAAQDVAGYNVRYSYLGLEQVGGIPSSDPFPEDERVYYEATPPSGTASTEYSFGGIEGGSRLRIEVRAFDRAGNFGAWTSISHDSSNDATPPPVPAGPTGMKAWFKTLDIPWNGLGSLGEPMPIDFSHVRVWIGQGADMTLPAEPVGNPVQFNPALTTPQYVADLFAAGTWNQPDVPIGVGWYARLQAVDYTGNASAGSTVVGPVVTEQLVSDDLIDDIIDANKLGPNSVENQHVVNGAITTAKIVDANIVTAKIADLAVNNAKIADLSVGKLTTGTMTATVTVTGALWTSTDPNATRLGLSAAGLQLYRTNSPSAGSTLIGYWRTSDGGMLVTGTFQSALSGQRIQINPDGSMRFYPTSGTNYSSINNEGNDVVWRGPLDGSQRSGRVNVNILGVGINFSAEANLLENIRAEFLVLDRQTRMTAPFMNFQVDERWTNPVSGNRRLQFSHINSSGNFISRSGLSYGLDSSDYGGFYGNDTGWKLALNSGGDGRFTVTNGSLGNYGVAASAGWENLSSGQAKKDVADVRTVLDPLHTIRNARAKKYRYSWQRPDEPLGVGLIAEDLPEVLQRPMEGPDGTPLPGVELGSMIGVLWGAIGQLLDQEIVSTSGTALVDSPIPAGATVEVPTTWESNPPAPPTGGFVLVQSEANAGRVTAWIKTGSVTQTGCIVVFKNISDKPIASPLRASAIGLGLFTPPYTKE